MKSPRVFCYVVRPDTRGVAAGLGPVFSERTFTSQGLAEMAALEAAESLRRPLIDIYKLIPHNHAPSLTLSLVKTRYQ